jgi:hypothetical protein
MNDAVDLGCPEKDSTFFRVLIPLNRTMRAVSSGVSKIGLIPWLRVLQPSLDFR